MGPTLATDTHHALSSDVAFVVSWCQCQPRRIKSTLKLSWASDIGLLRLFGKVRIFISDIVEGLTEFTSEGFNPSRISCANRRILLV